MNAKHFIIVVSLFFSLVPSRTDAQAGFNTKWLLEDYSREMFAKNASGFMGPLVIVTNVGANDAFYNSAYVPKTNSFYFDFSARTMFAFVTPSEQTYTSVLPLEIQTYNPYPMLSEQWSRIVQLNLFKEQLQGAANAGLLETRVKTATVFGGQGSSFVIPKEYMKTHTAIDSATLARLPNVYDLTPGINQKFVAAAVPQLTVGSFYSTEALIRYIPPVILDVNIGRVSFFGIALKHAFTNWLQGVPFDAALQVGYQYTTIRNEVGVTKAKLEANTNLYAVNLQASRRWKWFEPYAGVSFESLRSTGSYTFTLPANMKQEIGYDIDPQTVPVTLSDDAVKATLGVTAHVLQFYAFASFGVSKHLIYSGGIGYRFDRSPTAR
jgi:hypothetical protein